MKELSKVTRFPREIGDEAAGQRIDNYLLKHLKGVPKSHVYRILRSGEVRVNSRRVGPDYRLNLGDRVRVPPTRVARAGLAAHAATASGRFVGTVLYEDDSLLALDKPAGVAVHGGSGVSLGVVEQLRRERPHARFLELVHRLDRDTSGVLLLAKKRGALTRLHEQLRAGQVQKVYLALVHGKWRDRKRNVRLPLEKYVLASGERRVKVKPEGTPSHTVFSLVRLLPEHSLLEAELKTGRTHQIRVHLAHLGFPIAGDEKYGDYELNRRLAAQGLKRMFLHASRIVIVHPEAEATLAIEAPLPDDLARFLERCAAPSTLPPSRAVRARAGEGAGRADA
jgi:23S rRNA pseudouridine955/2504/2580 synthase